MRLPSCFLTLAALPLSALAHPPPGVPAQAQSFAHEARAVGDHPLEELLGAVASARVDGWLFCGGEGGDPMAAKLVGLESAVERRWCYLLPPSGEPSLLVAREDSSLFDKLPGRRLAYHGWRDLDDKWKTLLHGHKRLAVSLARLDAATSERLRAAGVTAASAGDILVQCCARATPAEWTAHERAALLVESVRDESLKLINQRITMGAHANEFEVQQLATRLLESRGLEALRPVVVAAGVNTADPNYLPTAKRSSQINIGDLVVVAINARDRSQPRAPAVDLAWTFLVGDRVPPDEVKAAFASLVTARDRALAVIKSHREKHTPLSGWEVDALARFTFTESKHVEHALLPLGRSLLANGPALDDTDTRDERQIVPHTAYAIIPSLFVSGAFGVRTSIDIYLGDEEVLTSGHPQSAIENLKP